jgi:hypothetical protein
MHVSIFKALKCLARKKPVQHQLIHYFQAYLNSKLLWFFSQTVYDHMIWAHSPKGFYLTHRVMVDPALSLCVNQTPSMEHYPT